jgi:integrase
MGIYERPDSKYWWVLIERKGQKPIRFSTEIPIDGGSVNQTRALKHQAQEAYATQKGDLARQRFQIPTERERRGFSEHRAWYAEHVSSQKRGKVRERSILRQLGAFFDTYSLDQIDQTLVREWRSERRANVSAATVYREEALLKNLLSMAVPKYLEKNPLAGMKMVRVPETDTRVLTRDEEAALLKALETAEDYAIIVCALDTLLRLSNVKDLTRQQDHGGYLFSDAKAGAVRIPISTRLRKALDALPVKGAHYFPTYHAGGNYFIQKMFDRACKRADLVLGRKEGGLSFHCLRHTGATRMLASGADVKTVMEIGGWKNLKVMARYLHPTDDRKRDAVEAVGPPQKKKRPKR